MEKIPTDLKETIIFRLSTMPPGRKISISPHGEFSRNDLIEHVKKEDAVGKKIIEVELEFMRAKKEGEMKQGAITSKRSKSRSL